MRLTLNDADVHAKRRQRLAHAVVQLPRQSPPLLILHRLQTRRKLDDLLLCRQVGDQNSGCRFVARQDGEREISGDQPAVRETHMHFSVGRQTLILLAATSGRQTGPQEPGSPAGSARSRSRAARPKAAPG